MRTLVKKRIAERKKQVPAKIWKRMFLVDEIDVMNVLVHELDEKIKEVLATLGIEGEYLQIRAAAERAVDGSKANAAVDRANAFIDVIEPQESIRSEDSARRMNRFRSLKV